MNALPSPTRLAPPNAWPNETDDAESVDTSSTGLTKVSRTPWVCPLGGRENLLSYGALAFNTFGPHNDLLEAALAS